MKKDEPKFGSEQPNPIEFAETKKVSAFESRYRHSQITENISTKIKKDTSSIVEIPFNIDEDPTNVETTFFSQDITQVSAFIEVAIAINDGKEVTQFSSPDKVKLQCIKYLKSRKQHFEQSKNNDAAKTIHNVLHQIARTDFNNKQQLEILIISSTDTFRQNSGVFQSAQHLRKGR
ncbi:hypothetical protein GF376_01080 [Candidatus Peregrinibacteria bacterium]|nr:hypothetical protein [Candidatus Peregrinibacteria bacterium]